MLTEISFNNAIKTDKTIVSEQWLQQELQGTGYSLDIERSVLSYRFSGDLKHRTIKKYSIVDINDRVILKSTSLKEACSFMYTCTHFMGTRGFTAYAVNLFNVYKYEAHEIMSNHVEWTLWTYDGKYSRQLTKRDSDRLGGLLALLHPSTDGNVSMHSMTE